MFAIIKGQGRDRVNFLWENFFAVIRDHGCVSSRDTNEDLGSSTDLFLRDFDLLFEALRLLATGGKDSDSHGNGSGSGGGGAGTGGPGAGGSGGLVSDGFSTTSTGTFGPSSTSTPTARRLKTHTTLGAFGGVTDIGHTDENSSRDWASFRSI